MPKKIALIDMDYVLCDYQATMEPYLKSLESPEEVDKYDYSNMWVLEKEYPHIKRRLHPIMSKQGFWTGLKPIDAGLQLYKYISERFETYILSKALKNCSLAWKEKVDWLHKYIGNNIEIMLVTNKKLVVGDLLVDDMPENAEDFLKLNPKGRVIMPIRKHNESLLFGPCDDRIDLWDDSLYFTERLNGTPTQSYNFKIPYDTINTILKA